MKAAINHHKSTLAQIPDAIKQKKQELLAKVREGRAIRSSLENIPGSAEEDKQQITEVDAIRLESVESNSGCSRLVIRVSYILCRINGNHTICPLIVLPALG